MSQNYSADITLNSSSFITPLPALKQIQNRTFTEQYAFPFYAKVLFYIIQCILSVLGLFGNILVILSVRRNPHMKKSISNLFIQNLAVADVGVLAISHTFVLGLEIKDFVWPFGEFCCRVIYPFSDSFYGVSIWSIVAISFHRYRGIAHIMRIQLSRKKAHFILAAAWLLPVIIISLPLWIFMRLIPAYQLCDVIWPSHGSRLAYFIILNFLFYVLPLAMIVYFYLRIRVALKASSGFHRQMTKSSSKSALRDDLTKQIQRNAKALRVLTPVVVVFFATMLPFTAFRLAFVFTDMSRFRYTRTLFFASIISVLANSSANPLIYTIVSPEFRRSFMEFLGLKKCLKGNQNSAMRKSMLSRKTSEYFSTLNGKKSDPEERF